MDRKTFILSYLVSIATILGSGILGLPVSIAYRSRADIFECFLWPAINSLSFKLIFIGIAINVN